MPASNLLEPRLKVFLLRVLTPIVIGTFFSKANVMKRVLFFALAAVAVVIASCTKEDVKEMPDNVIETGKTITFTASIDMKAETKATLSGLNINWSSGDYIGIATDNNATIVAYPVTPDGTDPTKCSITVNAVEGAKDYYAVFKGSLGDDDPGTNAVAADDFSSITFDTTTKTFSGLKVGNQQVAVSSLSSHLFYSNGYPLAMAGKANGTTLIMKPCLALVKLQIHSESVPTDYCFKTITYTSTYNKDHEHSYSAVRGFNFYQIGSDTKYSSGDFDVQIAANGDLVTTPGSTKKEYRQMTQSAKLSADTDYIMCVIPGGSISSFKVDFLGYKDNTPTNSWDAVYSMSKAASISVAPGDCYDLGKLNPLARKKAKDEADDEAEDEAAASYVPAIMIDGDMSDWSGISAFGVSVSGRIREWKFKSDSQNVYFYLALRRNRAHAGNSLYVGFDTDNNNSTGTSANGMSGLESYAKSIPFTNEGEASVPIPVNGVDSASEIRAGSISSVGLVKVSSVDPGGSLSDDSINVYVELSIPRNKLNLPAAGSTITVNCSYQYGYLGAAQSVTLE